MLRKLKLITVLGLALGFAACQEKPITSVSSVPDKLTDAVEEALLPALDQHPVGASLVQSSSFQVMGADAVLALSSISSNTLIERFDNPLPGWKTRWLYQNSNIRNYYEVYNNCWNGPDCRGNNLDGIWVSDGSTADGNAYIRFNTAFGASLTRVAFDLGAHGGGTLKVYDKNMNVLLNTSIPVGCANCLYAGSPNVYAHFNVTSSNGIAGFDLTGCVEGCMGIDNVEVDAGPTQAAQTITFGPIATQTYGTPLQLTATSSSGLPVTYAASGNCSVSGSTVTFTSTGSCTITASQAGDANYSAATPVSQTFSIAQAQQAITFNPTIPLIVLPAGDVPLSATASSNLPVTFTATGPCTIAYIPNVYFAHPTGGAGDCIVTASQAGDANYVAAPNVSHTIKIQLGTITVNWAQPADITYGTPLSPAVLNATFSPNVAGTTVYSPAVGTLLSAGTHTLSVTFTPSDPSYSPATASVQLTVQPKAITVTPTNVTRVYGLPNPTTWPMTYSPNTFPAGDSPTSLGTPVVSGPAAATTSTSNVGTYDINVGGLSNPNYAITYGTGVLTITKATSPVNFTGGTVFTYDGQPHGIGVSGASLAVPHMVVTYNGSTTAPTNAGVYAVVGKLDDPNWNYAENKTTLTINKKQLLVKADTKHMQYADPVPALTYTVTGFVNGEDATVISGAPMLTTAATSDSPAGSYPIQVNVSAMSATNYFFAGVGASLIDGKRDAVLAYTGDTFAFTSGPNSSSASMRLSANVAHVGNDVLGDITRARASLVVTPDNGPEIRFDNLTPDASGNVSVQTNLAEGVYDVRVELVVSNNWYWRAPTVFSTVTVAVPTTEQRITGGGWVDGVGGKTNYGFTVSSQKNGNPKGNAVVTFRGDDGYNYRLKSNSWSGGGATYGINGDAGRARFVVKGNLQKIDAETGEIVATFSSQTLTVDVLDNGSADSIGIVIANGNSTVRSVGFTATGGGNIDVKSK